MPDAPMPDAPDRFRSALAAFYREEATRAGEERRALEVLAGRLGDPALPPGRPQRRQLDAMALLPAALQEACRGPLGWLAAAFAELEPRLGWTQNRNYSDDKLGPGHMANYAYAVFAGPGGLLEVDDILVSVLLIGPQRLYPAHAHEAEEVYHLLAGPSLWWREGENWTARGPGELVHHRPWQPHATKTGNRSLLALASWNGDPRRMADLLPGARVPAIPT